MQYKTKEYNNMEINNVMQMDLHRDIVVFVYNASNALGTLLH